MGKKAVTIPAVKVADGVIATSQLVYLTLASANTATAADGFQREISRQQNAQIKYLISQAKVRTSELNTTYCQGLYQGCSDDIQGRPKGSCS